MILSATVKSLLGSLAVIISLVGYIPYFRDIWKGKTKPHAFSWLVWGTLAVIAFGGQMLEGAGPGAWVTAVSAASAFVVFSIALKKGEVDITTTDWLSLFGAGLAMLLWAVSNEPLLAIILVIIIDFLGFLPTIRKSYKHPHQETLISYFLAGLKFVIALIALDNYSLVTWLYPGYLVIVNGLFVLLDSA